MPSLSGVFYICEYLGITPSQFFDMDSGNPNRFNDILQDMKQLNDQQLELVAAIIREIKKD